MDPRQTARFREDLQFELAQACYQLGLIHGRLHDLPLQETMLQKSVQTWESLIAEHSNPSFRFHAAFAALATAELFAETGRMERAEQQGELAIAQFRALQESDTANNDYSIALAHAHSRVGAMLAYVLPFEKVEEYHRTAIKILQPFAERPAHLKASRLFPFDDGRDALAECRLHLASAKMEFDSKHAIPSASGRPRAKSVGSRARQQPA